MPNHTFPIVFAIAVTVLASTLLAADARAARHERCGPYATPGVDQGGNPVCTLLPPEARQQIIRARQQANAQRQRTRQLEIDQRQRNAAISKALNERDEAVLDRDKALARGQRQPEEELKQETKRRYWPRY